MGSIKLFFQKIADTLSSGASRVIWVVLFGVSVLGLIDILGSPTLTLPLWLQWVSLLLISAFKATFFTVLVAISTSMIFRFAAWAVVGIYALLCVINACTFVVYGIGISHRLVTLFMQTNLREISEYFSVVEQHIFSSSILVYIAVVVGVLVLFSMLLRIMTRKSYLRMILISFVVGFATLVCALGYLESRAALIMLARVPKNIRDTFRENAEFQRILDLRQSLPYADSVKSSGKTPTIIMIIGESASRSHHSLYGYKLPTTPGIDGMKDSLFVMQNAIASSAATHGNMERILSLKIDDQTYDDWYKYPLLIDIFNAAKYKTFWLSNQERKGLISNSSGVMAGNAAVVKYMGVESSEDAYAYRYDEVLLPEIYAALSDTAKCKFIGIHLLGSHFKYVNRYPTSEAYFSADSVMQALPRTWLTPDKAQTVAEYDNSIRYTDKILTEIVEAVARQAEPACLVYFSDHGENVYDTHDYMGRDERFVEVPFFFYVNSAFRGANSEMLQHLSDAQNRQISTATIDFSLMNIAGIEYPLYDATNDFLSPEFRARPRYVDEVIWKYEKADTLNCD